MNRFFDDPSGLRMLGGLMSVVVIAAMVSSGSWVALALGLAGIGTVFGLTEGIIKAIFPYAKEENAWNRFLANEPKTFELISGGGRFRPEIRGFLNEARIEIEPTAPGARTTTIRARVPTTAHSDYDLSLFPLGDEGDQQTWDPEFDAVYRVRASGPEWIATLDAETRRDILALGPKYSIEFGHRGLSLTLLRPEAKPAFTHELIDELTHLAQRIYGLETSAIMPQLFRNAHDDPHPSVRAQNLRAAFEWYPADNMKDVEHQHIVRLAFDDDDVDLTIAGAVGLAAIGSEPEKKEAQEQLEALAEWSSLELRLRDLAIRALAEHFDSKMALVCFERILSSTEEVLPLAVIGAYTELGEVQPVGRWVERLAGDPRANEILDVFDRLAIPSYDEALFPFLDHVDPAVVLGTIHALSRWGSIRSIEAVFPLTRGLSRDDHVKDAAKVAVNVLRERHGTGTPGRLTMIEDAETAGELSLAPDQGSLSKPEESRDDRDGS